MTPKVSVVVPVYNVEPYLKRCVESLRNQTLRDIEIILVDDESPDRCPAMCDEYARRDPRIRVVHKKNAGLGMARNSGLGIAIGEYITFCDSDDWLDHEAYETIYNICKKDNLDLCCFQSRRVRLDGSIINQNPVQERNFEGPAEIKDFHLGIIGKDPTKTGSETYGMSSCMAMFNRKNLIDSNVRYPSERLVASEDLVFIINLIPYLSRVKIVPNVFYNYLINPASISQNYSEAKHERLINLAQMVWDYCEQNFSKEEYLNHYYTQLLRVFKVILKYISHSNEPFFSKIKHLSKETRHPLLRDFYNSKVINSYSLTDRVYVTAMKLHIGLFFALLYKLK